MEEETIIDASGTAIKIDDIKDVLVTIPYTEYIHYGVVLQKLRQYKDKEQELITWLKKKLETLDDEVPTANQTEYLIIDTLNKIKEVK